MVSTWPPFGVLYRVNGSVSLCAGLCLSALYIVRVLLVILVFGCEN